MGWRFFMRLPASSRLSRQSGSGSICCLLFFVFILTCHAAPDPCEQGGQEKAGNKVARLWHEPVRLFGIALPANSPVGEASLREHAYAWHPVKRRYYLVADVVPLCNPHHPNTYNTELYLWSSSNLTNWTFHGVAVPKGVPGESYDGYGVASPAGMAYCRGRLWVPFSARKTQHYTQRSIGLAWSGADPEQLPWTKSDSPVSDLAGEDDDPAVISLPNEERLHLYHRATNGGYHIAHTASATPDQPATWPTARPVTVRTADVRAQELTGVAFHDGQIHLFIMEHLNPQGLEIGHFISRTPDAIFQYASLSKRFVDSQPKSRAYGGHVTPICREGLLVGLSWTVPQAGKRYGIAGYTARWQ